MEVLRTRSEFGSKIYGKLVKQYPQLACESAGGGASKGKNRRRNKKNKHCLLYTSDAADE